MRLLALALLASLAAPLAAQAPRNSGPNTLSSTAPPTSSQSQSQAEAPAGTTISVPLRDGDPLTITGLLALRHRGARQFLVLESPTPFRITNVLGSPEGKARPHIVRDIPFTLPGKPQDLSSFVGQTLTASGTVHLQPTPTTWNGLTLQTKTLILPGGHEIHPRR